MQEIIRTLAWTFLHSLWQGLIAALLAALIISSTRKSAARLRYNLLGTVFLLFLVSSMVTFAWQWNIETRSVAAFAISVDGDIQVVSHTSGIMDRFATFVDANSALVVLSWSIFFLLGCSRMIVGLSAVNRLRHYQVQPAGEQWQAKLETLCQVSGIRRTVSLVQSGLVKVPMALGVFKPIILVPLGLLAKLPAEQVETILLHELAHIRRRDYLINLLQHVAETIFFFNPALRWISAQLRQEREACCDDMVVAHYGQKGNYLNALVSFQEYALGHSPYVMGIGKQPHYLLNRVQRLMTNRNKGMTVVEKTAIIAGLVLFSAFSFVTREQQEEATWAIQPPTSPVAPLPISSPLPPAEKAQNNINVSYFSSIDTTPARKSKMKRAWINSRKQEVKAAQKEKEKLREIEEIKNKIGKKKEQIGALKEQLKVKDDAEKEKILKKLERERGELDGQRGVLERKRKEWDKLKEAAKKEKQLEKESAKEEEKDDDDDGDGDGNGNNPGNHKSIEKEKIKSVEHETKKSLINKKSTDRVDQARGDSIKRVSITRASTSKSKLLRNNLHAEKKSRLFSDKKSVLFKKKQEPAVKESPGAPPSKPAPEKIPKEPAAKKKPAAKGT